MSTPLTPTLTNDNAVQSADALAELHKRTVDALAGYETMVDKAEPEFRDVARRFRDLHSAHAHRMAAMLVAHGRSPDTDGSFMATVNRTVVAARAWFDEIDADVMAQVRSGEAHVIEAFDEASTRLEGTEQAAAIREMRGELDTLLRETATLDQD